MKTDTKITLLAICLSAFLVTALASEAPKVPDAPKPTIESLTAENADLKKQVAKLTTENAQLNAMLNKAVEQRNEAQNAELNKAAQAAAKP